MSSEEGFYRHGDRWTEHYRGSKYRCNPNREVWWALPAGLARVKATAGFEEFVDAFLALRPEGGSFRITETGAVITKVPPDWEPVYVGEYDLLLEFEHLDVLGTGIEPLDIWPSFYDGARYSYKRGKLWWKNREDLVWQQTVEALPRDLEERLLKVKPEGGTIRITENAKVLVLIKPQPLPKHLKPQYEALNDAQKRLIQVKTETTDLLPIFLGEFHGGFTLRPARNLTDPMSSEEEAALMDFLMKYGRGVEDELAEPFDEFDAVEEQLDLDDDE